MSFERAIGFGYGIVVGISVYLALVEGDYLILCPAAFALVAFLYFGALHGKTNDH